MASREVIDIVSKCPDVQLQVNVLIKWCDKNSKRSVSFGWTSGCPGCFRICIKLIGLNCGANHSGKHHIVDNSERHLCHSMDGMGDTVGEAKCNAVNRLFEYHGSLINKEL